MLSLTCLSHIPNLFFSRKFCLLYLKTISRICFLHTISTVTTGSAGIISCLSNYSSIKLVSASPSSHSDITKTSQVTPLLRALHWPLFYSDKNAEPPTQLVPHTLVPSPLWLHFSHTSISCSHSRLFVGLNSPGSFLHLCLCHGCSLCLKALPQMLWTESCSLKNHTLKP